MSFELGEVRFSFGRTRRMQSSFDGSAQSFPFTHCALRCTWAACAECGVRQQEVHMHAMKVHRLRVHYTRVWQIGKA